MQQKPPRHALFLQAFYFSSHCAEAMQGLGMVLAVFMLTHSSVWVGIIGAAAYLPGVIASVLYHSSADKPGTEQYLSRSNTILAVGATALLIAQFLTPAPWAHLTLFLIIQSSLSIVKAFNKSYAGRIVRLNFPGPTGKKIIQRATSFGILGGLAGVSMAGLIVDFAGITWCFTASAACYAVSLLCAKASLARTTKHSKTKSAANKTSAHKHSPATMPTPMRIILLFSIPSSALLPYVNTLTVPIAHTLRGDSIASYLSILTATAALGGITAGIVIGSDRIPLATILTISFPLVSLCSIGLIFYSTFTTTPAFLFIYTFFATAHVLSMQVLTNQVPPTEKVASFTLLRNAYAGLAKAGASLLAGGIVALGGLTSAWSAIAITLLFAQITWMWLIRTSEVKSTLSAVN